MSIAKDFDVLRDMVKVEGADRRVVGNLFRDIDPLLVWVLAAERLSEDRVQRLLSILLSSSTCRYSMSETQTILTALGVSRRTSFLFPFSSTPPPEKEREKEKSERRKNGQGLGCLARGTT